MTFNVVNFGRNVLTNYRIIDGEIRTNNWDKRSKHSPAQGSNIRSSHSSGDKNTTGDHDPCYGKRLVTFYARGGSSKASVVSAGES